MKKLILLSVLILGTGSVMLSVTPMENMENMEKTFETNILTNQSLFNQFTKLVVNCPKLTQVISNCGENQSCYQTADNKNLLIEGIFSCNGVATFIINHDTNQS